MRLWLLAISLAACSAGGSSSGTQAAQPLRPPPAPSVPLDAAPVPAIAVDAEVVAPDGSATLGMLADAPIVNEQSDLHAGGAFGATGTGASGAAGAPAPSRDRGPEGHVSITPLSASTDSTLRVVRARMGIYRACYQRALNQDPGLAGRFAASIEIGADGVVANVTKTGGSVGANQDLGSCLIANLKRLRFPANDPRTPVFAFDFSSTVRPGY